MGDKTTDKSESFEQVRWDSCDRKHILKQQTERWKSKVFYCIVFYWFH